MFLKPDWATSHTFQRLHTGLLGCIAATVLAGCGTVGAPEPAATCQTCGQATSITTEAPASLRPTEPSTSHAISRMLAYAERVRQMPPSELMQEFISLSDGASPTEQMQRSLVLRQRMQLPDILWAQGLLERVLANDSPEAQSLHALARLLAAHYSEQRLLAEQLELQTQQTRDVQRRLDQTNELLEALKAIERSLTNRPAAPASRRSNFPAP